MAFDENGLVPLRYNEIEKLIQDTQVAEIPETISYQNSNLIHQLNSVYSAALDQVSYLAEAAFDTLALNSASGRYLEQLGVLRGVYRIDAQSSTTSKQYAWLGAGSTIPAGSIFSAPNLGGITATNPSSVTGSTSACSAAETLTNVTVVTGAAYGWSINGTNYSYTALVSDTVQDIHDALILLLDADTSKTFTYTEQASGSSRSFIFTANEDTFLNITPLSVRISFVRVKVYFSLELIEKGATDVPAGEMNTLQSPSAGFLETTNEDDFILGREVETDVELRVRIQSGSVGDYAGTPDTIVQGLLTNVPGVTYVLVVENLDYDTGFPVDADGRPWLSYETIVLGGSDSEVAQEIWRTRPVNARTYGNVANEQVVDSSGVTQFVSFSRPSQVTINVVITHDTSLAETDFPPGGGDAMQTAVISYLASLPLGQNVVGNRLYSVAYEAIGGRGTVITSITIEDADNPGVTPVVQVPDSGYAFTEVGNVTITDATP